jgi:hypothetical protein
MDKLELGVGGGARQSCDRVSAAAHKTAAKVGDQMRNFAGQIRDTGPRVGSAIHNGLERFAQKFERGGAYFTERRYEEMIRNSTQYIRRHPVISIALGIAAGILLANKRRH